MAITYDWFENPKDKENYHKKTKVPSTAHEDAFIGSRRYLHKPTKVPS